MIQRIRHLGEGRLHIEKIGDESGMRVDRPLQLDFDPIGMAMQPMAPMRSRYSWKTVRRLELSALDLFIEFRCAVG